MKRSSKKSIQSDDGANGTTNGTTNGYDGNGHLDGDLTKRSAGGLGHQLKKLWERTVVPIFLMIFSPNMTMLMWYAVARCDGSYIRLWEALTVDGFVNGLTKIWMDIDIGSSLATYVLLGYILWAMFLQVTLPGQRVEGPVTPKGNVPVYTDNGFKCYLVTMVAFCILTVVLKQFGMTPTVVYDHFDEFLGTLTVFSHVLCLFLHVKGLLFPSSSDCGSSGNLVFDYYWGTELYPRVFGVDIKVFTNCRFGMTVWPLLVAIFALKNYELYGFVDSMWVSAALQLTYCTKFFWWEAGYMRTIDIMVDRAGFYICWGCLAFIPGMYASVSMYLVSHPVILGPLWSAVILFCGVGSIYVNYWADQQKLEARRTEGNCNIWGKKAEVIKASYKLESGEQRESLLLVSGFWGVARHFHYMPELLLTLFWSLPGLFENFLVYTYFFWLVVLLVHRTFRDDLKCTLKYTRYWAEYCKRVPYKMVPGIF